MAKYLDGLSPLCALTSILISGYVRQTQRHLEQFLLPTDTHNAESVELLNHSKIDKNAPTCFGLHRDHLQGAKVSTLHVSTLNITCNF